MKYDTVGFVIKIIMSTVDHAVSNAKVMGSILRERMNWKNVYLECSVASRDG